MVRASSLNAVIQSLLLLLGQFILVNDLELRTKSGILSHILNDSGEFRYSFFIKVLLVIDL